MFFENPAKWPEGPGTPSPKSGIRRVGYVLTSHFFQLVKANLLFVLFSIPLVTMPAAMLGLHAVVQELFRKGYGDVWPVFIREFKTNFFKRLAVTILLAALPVAGWMLGSSQGEIQAYAMSAILTTAVLMVTGWLYPQWAILRLSTLLALRNACILTMLEGARSLCLVFLMMSATGLLVLFRPASYFLLLFIGPALTVLLQTAVVNPVLEKRLIQETEEVL